MKLMLYCILFHKVFGNIKLIKISFHCRRHITQKAKHGKKETSFIALFAHSHNTVVWLL